jgi:hypothetical protein
MKRKSKNKPTDRQLLADAHMVDIQWRLGRVTLDMYYLQSMDPNVATAALECFKKPELAAIWLTTPLKQLWGKSTRECKKEDVLQVLELLERGVFG